MNNNNKTLDSYERWVSISISKPTTKTKASNISEYRLFLNFCGRIYGNITNNV